MTKEDIELVKSSWAIFMPISEATAKLFYGKLFEIDPTLKLMFSDSMEEQGKKLILMVDTAVNNLDQPDQIVPAIQALGERHVTYGVKAAHYDSFGEALIWTLRRGLGPGFTDDIRNAWLTTYALLADTMQGSTAQSIA